MLLVRIDLPQSIGAERASIGEIVYQTLADMFNVALEWSKVFGKSLRWEDLGWLRSLTSLPLLLKEIQRSDDVRCARDYGSTAACAAARMWQKPWRWGPQRRGWAAHTRMHWPSVAPTAWWPNCGPYWPNWTY